MALFGSSGIRGKLEEVTTELMMKIGRAVGQRYGRVVIGHDTRTSSQMLTFAFASGLLSAGSEATSVGLVSTPTLAYAARRFECGAMITASHNPPEYNGIKLWNPDGLAFQSDQRDEFEQLIQSENLKRAKWRELSTLLYQENAIREHIESILSKVGKSRLKVIVDCGNGATSSITPMVLEKMGCKVVGLNCNPDGYFTARGSEPTQNSLSLLRSAVRTLRANLGIAHDGDGDRMVAVDEKGNYVGGDRLLPLFATREVKNSLVVPVNASMVLDDILEGRKIWRSRVGDVYVGEDVKKREADFGGEPSGTWIFPRNGLFPDGVYAAARLVEIVSQKPLSLLLETIPSYPIFRGSLPIKGERGAVLEALRERIFELERVEVNTTDGWRLDFGDGWALIRASGTEPKLRITAEARKVSRAKEIYQSMNSIARKVIE